LSLLTVFDICHGCRPCFNLCPSFPALFGAIDHLGTEDVRDLNAEQKQRVNRSLLSMQAMRGSMPIYASRLSRVSVGFPRLIMRARAVNGRERGIPLRDRILGDPDRAGKMGTNVPRLANLACRGDKIMPDFTTEKFTTWIERHGLSAAPAHPTMKIAIFHTCLVDYYIRHLVKR
jgi:glycerol-3-phosphate dehydrogenase subunit C